MIPQFPTFKKIEITDENEIRSYTRVIGASLYSDFCFVSMWIWDTANDMSISLLNGNLVVLFRDYTSHEAFLSFVGKSNLDITVRTLIAYSKQHLKISQLRLISEEIACLLSKDHFSIIASEDSHDYVYQVAHLAEMNQWKGSKSKKIRKFLKNHSSYDVQSFPLIEAPIIELVELFERWAKNKKVESIFDLNEFHAFQRLLQLKSETVYVMLLSAGGTLYGFTVYEFIGDRSYAISHFAKADTTYDRDIYDIMNWEEAKLLKKAGVTYYNWEQDLGIAELRDSKMSYGPAFLLKKYIVDEVK